MDEQQRELLMELVDIEKLDRVSRKFIEMCLEERLNYVEMLSLLKTTLETMSENGVLWDLATDNLDKCGPVLRKVAELDGDLSDTILDVHDKDRPNMGC